MGLFAPAVKHESKLRLAIMGPSGSGKTFSALAIAAAMKPDCKIAMVDTEHGSAAKYADLFHFDVLEMQPPFHPDRFVEAIKAAAGAGYDVIILDSLTHAWNGTGGLLDEVDRIAKVKTSGNTFAAWKEGTPIQNRLTDAIVGAGLHVIATIRAKEEFVQEKDERGKTVVKKLGMGAEQRNGFQYEFDVVIEMKMDHEGIVTKTRCTAITDQTFPRPGANVAAPLVAWLQGAPAPKGKPEGNGNQNGSAPAPVWQAWKAPADAFAWAIEQGACANEFEAKNSLKKIVDQHGGRLNSGNMAEVFAAYHAHQIDKLAAAQPAPAVPEDVNFGMGDHLVGEDDDPARDNEPDDDAPVPTIHMAEQPALVTGGGKGTY